MVMEQQQVQRPGGCWEEPPFPIQATRRDFRQDDTVGFGRLKTWRRWLRASWLGKRPEAGRRPLIREKFFIRRRPGVCLVTVTLLIFTAGGTPGNETATDEKVERKFMHRAGEG